MRAWCRWMALAALLTGGVAHAAQGPGVRVQVQGKQPVLVGQQVPVEVTVVAPNYFLSAPPFPDLVLQGAIVTMPDDRSIHGVDTVDGQTLASIQKTYVFTAQQAGDFELPPVRIDFSYQGDDGKPQQANLTLPSTRIGVQLPAGTTAAAAAGAALMPATRLLIQQSLDRDASQLSAGDALVRTVQIQAANTPAMLIPPPKFEAPSGVQMFQADPVLSNGDGRDGGFAGGQRLERVTYVFEKSGSYTLPAVELQWLDPQTQKPATAQAPAVMVQVKASAHLGDRIAPALPAGASSSPARKPVHWSWIALAVAGVALLLATGWWVRSRLPRWRQRRAEAQAAHARSDDAMFEHLLVACRAGDARAAHTALLDWCRAHVQATPQAWAAQLGDGELAAQVERLGRQLYRAGPGDVERWRGEECAQALGQAHLHWQAQSGGHATRGARGRHLGPLNPLLRGR
ncbi:BatD family protein [Variovorax sp. OV329]|uniref:BatD family protein n=1 Tax=Variovorax sp. OV329 TaxID=1882825 RepID=UPI0008E8D31B|nr:BatD family protein [Variovorax sp. OV329]SFN11400.1 Oxygen tolerance [Variovorax sp. OV329]